MPKGIVVDHKESGVRYAISERNFNEKVHTRVRELKPGETIIGFQLKHRDTPETEDMQPLELEPPEAPAQKTEGSPTGGTKGK